MRILKPNSVYMLSRSGKLIEVQKIHPYVNRVNSLPRSYRHEDRCIDNTIITKKEILWFFENSENSETKELALECYNRVKDLEGETVSLKENIEPFILLEELINEEFCRVRTGHKKYPVPRDNGEVYFRISSTKFDWFNIIWDLVMENESCLTNVTIVRDCTLLSKNHEEYFLIGNDMIYMMPVEEFLTAPGNPVIR